MVYESKSVKKTQELAKEIATKINKLNPNRGAIVVALEGELGAGKTTFVQGFVKGLKVKNKIKSPTFVLMKDYAIPGGKHLYHLDCYRLRDRYDLEPLGVVEIMKEPKNIVLIEWSERVAEIIPKEHIKIHLDHIDENTRKITIQGLE